MDKHQDVHNAIRKTFGIRWPKTVLPFGTNRHFGKRELFPGLFARLGFNTGAEVGVRTGKFAKLLLDANPNLTLYCIDPWMAYQRYSQIKQDAIYQKAVETLSKYKTVIIRKTSMDALSDVADRSLDFIHIDGNHEFDYICPDIIFWAKKVKDGGIITVHDYHAGYWYGVMQAVNAYTHCHNINPWYVLKHDQPTAFWVNEVVEEYPVKGF